MSSLTPTDTSPRLIGWWPIAGSRMLTLVVLMAVFGAGVAVGSFRTHWSGSDPVPLEQQVDDSLRRIERALSLTPVQRSAVAPLIRTALERRRELQRSAIDDLHATLAELERSVAILLEPSQRQRWQEFIEAYRSRLPLPPQQKPAATP
jgi:hypothetical protein